MIIFIVVLAVLIIPLVVGSVFVCVPKWWTKSVGPRIPEWLIVDLSSRKHPILARADRAMMKLAKILLAPIVFIVALVVWLIRGWFVIGLAAIEGVCPYNGKFRWRECLSEWFYVGKKPLKDLSPEDVLGLD